MPATLTPKDTADQDAKRVWQQAKESAIKARFELVRRQEILPSGEFADALGVSRESLSDAVATRRLFALELAGETYYPAFFIRPNPDRKKLERVSLALGDISGWSKWQFFTTPKGSLGNKTPLQALKDKGSLEVVVTSALGFAER